MTRISNFADRLKEIMEGRGYSYGKLGELLNMNPQTLNRYVLGTRIPKIDVMVAIATALEVEPMWLQGFDTATETGGDAGQSAEPADRSEAILLNHFRGLNPDGKTKAIAYSHALLGLYPAVEVFTPIPELSLGRTKEAALHSEEPSEQRISDGNSAFREEPDQMAASEEMESICRKFSISYEMDLVEYKLTQNILILCARPNAFGDEDDFISISCRYAASISARLFQSDGAETAAFFFQTDMVDRDGNESIKNVLKIILSRNSFRLQEDLDALVASDYNLVFRMADEYYIHPAINAKLKQYKA